MLIYSRNTDPLATDDYGQVVETRPVMPTVPAD